MEQVAEQFALEDLGELDITTDDIDFEEVEEELEKFQSDNIIQEALSKGVDLKDYSKQIEQELQYVENLCVQDYLDQASDLASLHKQVKQCDNILERMEDMLSHFKSDLGTISAEIQSLQDKSTAMKTKLKNRLGAQQLLSIVVGSIDIPAEMVKSLTEGEIDEEFSDWLAVLTDRLKYLADPANRTSVAANELFPVVEKLRLKALARIHEYLLARFHALKKPQTNIQIKQQLLLKAAPLNDFIVSQKEREDVVLEVRNTYIEVMAKIYSSKFKVYMSDLKKLQESASMKKTDVIGAEDTKSTGFFVGGKSSDQMSKLFRMNQRDSVLTDVQSDCIVAHVFSQNNVKLPYERIFRSFHRLLLDTATAEYDFLLNFFAYRRHLPKSQSQGASGSASSSSSSPTTTSATSSTATTPVAIHVAPPSGENGTFEAEFASSLAQTQREESEIREKKEEKQSSVENVALPTFGHDVKEEDEDAVMGIPEKDKAKRRAELALVKNMFAQIFRKTFALFSTSLEEHLLQCYDPIGIMLMIRVICQHNKIMQAKRIHCLDRFHDGTNMLLWPKFKVIFDANVQSVKEVSYARIKKGSAIPHYITSRYADFASAFLKLNKDYNDAILVAELRLLRVEVEKVFAKCAEKIISPRVVTIFYINTYNIILLAFLPYPESAEVAHFKELQAIKTKMYVEEELSERFGRLIEFLKKPSANPDVETVEQIIKHFARNWKDDVAAVSQSVRTNFADSGDTDIVKQVLVQLVLYYSRFQEIIKKMPTQPPSVQEVLPQSTLMYEIKKYWNQAA